eukprot:14474120-Ditylum_brightwellii.AAC.1
MTASTLTSPIFSSSISLHSCCTLLLFLFFGVPPFFLSFFKTVCLAGDGEFLICAYRLSGAEGGGNVAAAGLAAGDALSVPR